MAVYTQLELAQVAPLLKDLGLGEPLSLVGISQGIENTNYFVDTAEGRWVLTLFERIPAGELPFYLEMMHALSSSGLPVPDPKRSASHGSRVLSLVGKPAALVPCLPGADEPNPSVEHCKRMGVMLARLQMNAQGLALEQPNPRGALWRERTAASLEDLLPQDDAQLLAAELANQHALLTDADYNQLPQGAVHGDLFRDNVLWHRGEVSGVIDFYFAGHDTWLYDTAVALNDWCVDVRTGQLREGHAQALLDAYGRTRSQGGYPMAPAEWRLLPAARRMAALRFWLSRLADWHRPRPAHVLKPKDPQDFARALRAMGSGQTLI